jgi:hypothetical protein
VVTHWIVVTGVCSFTESVCRATLTIVVMPFDLMRHDMLMTYQPIPPERVLAIVDDLFMPLVAINRPS